MGQKGQTIYGMFEKTKNPTERHFSVGFFDVGYGSLSHQGGFIPLCMTIRYPFCSA